MDLIELGRIAKGLPSALKAAAEKDGLPAKIIDNYDKARPTREFSRKYPGTIGRIKAHYGGREWAQNYNHYEKNSYLDWYHKRYANRHGLDKRLSTTYAKAKRNKGQIESKLSYQRANAYRNERLKRIGEQNVGKSDLVSERVKAGMAPSPISAPARAKNGRLLNLSNMGDRQPVLGRGKPFKNGKVIP